MPPSHASKAVCVSHGAWLVRLSVVKSPYSAAIRLVMVAWGPKTSRIGRSGQPVVIKFWIEVRTWKVESPRCQAVARAFSPQALAKMICGAPADVQPYVHEPIG